MRGLAGVIVNKPSVELERLRASLEALEEEDRLLQGQQGRLSSMVLPSLTPEFSQGSVLGQMPSVLARHETEQVIDVSADTYFPTNQSQRRTLPAL